MAAKARTRAAAARGLASAAGALLLLLLASLSRGAEVVEYYHLDAIGNVRAVTNAAGQVVERHDYLPFGEECTTGPCASNPGLDAGQPRKFTGKERDVETGLDYFGARYYGSRIGRFTTVDPVNTWQQNLLDPQRWNRYAYGRNNPLRYVDPDGRAIETPWDALNVGLGVASFAANVAAGNVGGAIADALGIAYDAAATAVPVLPGGAGTAIRAARAADRVHDAAAALIATNRAAGKAAEAKIAMEVVEEGGRVLGSQVCCRTSIGRRVVDHVVEDAGGRVAAVEVKSGNATRSAVQRAKDAEITAGRGTFVGKNAPERLRGRNVPIETIERKPQ
jgi:RHS repeat-associated protein